MKKLIYKLYYMYYMQLEYTRILSLDKTWALHYSKISLKFQRF